MKKPILVGSAGLACLTAAALVVACSGGGSIPRSPTSTLKMTCTNRTLTSGAMSVTVACQGLTASGRALSAMLTTTLSGTATKVNASTTSSAVRVAAMSTNSFAVTPQSTGQAVVKLQDNSGDEVDVNEDVSEDSESPEPSPAPCVSGSLAPSETPESPEPSMSPEPSEAPESPEPCDAEDDD